MSITTVYNKNGLKNDIYTYDTDTKKKELKGTINYTSGYPIANYYKDKLYYTKRIGPSNFDGYSFVVNKDIKTGKVERDSHDYTHYNDYRRMINNKYMNVVKGNPDSEETKGKNMVITINDEALFNDNNQSVGAYNLSYNDTQIVYSLYNLKDRYDNYKKYNKSQNVKDLKYKETVYAYINNKNIKLGDINKKLLGLVLHGNDLYYLAIENDLDKNPYLYHYNIKTKETSIVRKLSASSLIGLVNNRLYYVSQDKTLVNYYHLKQKSIVSVFFTKDKEKLGQCVLYKK